MELVRCYLCDHEFVDGEEPWLMFEQRLREDGQIECSLAELLGSILEKQLEENVAHSTLLCDSCNADVLEYESLERRFTQLRDRILNSYNENVTLQQLNSISQILHNGTTSPLEEEGLKYDDLVIQSTSDVTVGVPVGDLVEEVQDGDVIIAEMDTMQNSNAVIDIGQKVISETYDFAAFNEHVAQNSLPSGLNLSDSLVNLSVSDTAMNVQDVPLEGGQDIIIYDVSTKHILEGDLIGQQDTADCHNVVQYKNDEDADLDFIITSNVFNDDDAKKVNESELESKKENDNNSSDAVKLPKAVCKQEGPDCTCLLCEISPKYTFDTLKEHFQTFHNTKIHMCDQCHEGFSRKQDLKQHTELGHAIECELCQQVFSNHRQYRIHRRVHYSSSKPYECSVCQKKYSSKGMLEEHMNTHTGVRPYKCPECPKDFASKCTLQTHMKIHKERPRPFHCDQCGKQFLNMQNLTQHKKLHVSVKAFECEVCNKTFTTQHSLQVHQIVHSGQRPFICRICGKSFARRPEIKDHERIHTGEKPYKCDLCPLAFAQRSNLTSHKKSTHLNEKLHKCVHCLRSFKRKRLLEYHIQAIHTGERPHKCEICGAGFVYPEHFKKHMHIHSGKKPFACEVCGKQFSSRDNRNAHRFVHSDKKPYECMECGAGFMRKPLLLTHMKQTKHTSDTIIINQPQFTQQFTAEDQLISMDSNSLQDGDDIDNGLEAECSEESLIFKPDDLLTVDSSVAHDVNDDAIAVESHLIKDELGVVKYLQFEDLERDGNQTLTWVDIGDNKL